MLRLLSMRHSSQMTTKSSQVWLRRKRTKMPLPRNEGPIQLRTFQDRPEFRDRVSIVPETRQPFVPNTYSPEFINEQLSTPDKFDTATSKEWKSKLENDAINRHPSMFPLWNVEKNITMDGYGEVPDVIIYKYTKIETSSFCFHTLHNFNKFITKQLIKNDFDVLERFPSPPDEFTVEYAELINESRHLKMDKMKRNIVFAHMNAEESSALIRQFVEFCPENTTIKFTTLDPETRLDQLRFQQSKDLQDAKEELAKLKKVLKLK